MTTSPSRRTATPRPGLDRAAGGVVVDRDGARVLLRQPTPNPGYDDLAWTLAKGRLDGQSPEEAAVREVREELGVRAEIIAALPGWFEGTASTTAYFVMRWIADDGEPDDETAARRWATWDEAPALMRQGRNQRSIARDLAVLAEARALLGR